MQRGGAHFETGACGDIHGSLGRETPAELFPECLVGPVLHLVVRPALDVIAAASVRAHTAQGKTALVVGIDQLLSYRRHIREDSQPSKWIGSFKGLDFIPGDALPGNAVKPVAAGHEIADQLLLFTVLLINDARTFCVIVLDAQGRRFIMDNPARFVDMCLHQIGGDLGLTVDHDGFAVRVFGEVDPLETAIKGDVDPLVDESFAVHAFACFGRSQQVCHALFDHTRADATGYIFTAAAFHDDRIDPLQVEQARQQQP